ncbi:MAG TPA: hypothetical protein VHC73_14910 [Vitreimonas sp.]|jgi:hypothetical protein|nr:hypothetical protein [Vitreimonas sp.]
MKLVVRGVVGLVGVLALLMAAMFWLNPGLPAARLGVAALDALGFATLRADMGGFFAMAGILSLSAALRDSARLLTAPLLLVTLALAARIGTAALEGYTPAMAQPMAIEAVLVAVLALGRRTLTAA